MEKPKKKVVKKKTTKKKVVKKEVVKKNSGRPTKYKEEYCELLIDHMAQGFTFESFAGLVSVNLDTVYNWCTLFPKFSEAKSEARAKQLLADEKHVNNFISGKNKEGNASVLIFKMKSKLLQL